MKHKKKILDGLEAVKTAQGALTDVQAFNCKNLFPEWSASAHSYAFGCRVTFGGKLYKCLQDHTSQAGWTPAAAPSLWAEILPGQDGTSIGEWAQPDSTNPYMTGDKVTHGGKTWESTVDGNVWEPGVYGWKEITE